MVIEQRTYVDRQTGEEFTVHIGDQFVVDRYDNRRNLQRSRWEIAEITGKTTFGPHLGDPAEVIRATLLEGIFVDSLGDHSPIKPGEVLNFYHDSVVSLLKRTDRNRLDKDIIP